MAQAGAKEMKHLYLGETRLTSLFFRLTFQLIHRLVLSPSYYRVLHSILHEDEVQSRVQAFLLTRSCSFLVSSLFPTRPFRRHRIAADHRYLSSRSNVLIYREPTPSILSYLSSLISRLIERDTSPSTILLPSSTASLKSTPLRHLMPLPMLSS